MIVPPAMMKANFISTLPRTRCSRDATMDFPTMCARSVPTTKFIGRPVTNSPGPARKLPPTPKNPPKIPTMNPTATRYIGLICCPDIGKSIRPPSVGLCFDKLEKRHSNDLQHHALHGDQRPGYHGVNQLILIEEVF